MRKNDTNTRTFSGCRGAPPKRRGVLWGEGRHRPTYPKCLKPSCLERARASSSLALPSHGIARPTKRGASGFFRREGLAVAIVYTFVTKYLTESQGAAACRKRRKRARSEGHPRPRRNVTLIVDTFLQANFTKASAERTPGPRRGAPPKRRGVLWGGGMSPSRCPQVSQTQLPRTRRAHALLAPRSLFRPRG